MGIIVPKELRSKDSIRVFGELTYYVTSGDKRLARFSLKVNNQFNGGFAEPSFLYNICLDTTAREFTVYRQISQEIAPNQVDHFLLSILARPGEYEMEFVFHISSGDVIESNPVSLSTLLSAGCLGLGCTALHQAGSQAIPI